MGHGTDRRLKEQTGDVLTYSALSSQKACAVKSHAQSKAMRSQKP